MNLVIVETPAQVKVLSGVLGEGWRVEPCYSVVRDLPADKLGVDVNDGFRPAFAVVPSKRNLVRRLVKAIGESEAIYAATAPNRAGELAAWHVLALSPDAKDKPVYRVSLPALTPEAVRAAFASPRPLNMHWIEAELTRRIIDRLTGYGVNAAASKALGFKSALTYDGMLALRLLLERDREREAFTAEPRWRSSVDFQLNGARFTAQVLNAKGAPLALRSAEQTAQCERLLKAASFWVDKYGHRIKAHPAPAVLTAAGLIETAGRDLGLTPQRTLALASSLYEAGWITHLDGIPPAMLHEAAQAYIMREYGKRYVASDVPAAAGIAPTDVERIPENLPGDGAALYGLIWRRFVAAHMPPALERVALARIRVGVSREQPYPLLLGTQAKLIYVDGWQRVLKRGSAQGAETLLPLLKEGITLLASKVESVPASATPSARHTGASLVTALGKTGLTVPAAVHAVEQLHATGYLSADGEGGLTLTESGRALAGYLETAFGDLTSREYAVQFAADVERVASGEQQRLEVLRAFWTRFADALTPAEAAPPKRAGRGRKPIILRPLEEG